MAKYTVTIDEILSDPISAEKLTSALSSYPLYEIQNIDNSKMNYIPTREQLNTKLLNHYRFREIGFETIGRFLFELKTAMEEIMPYYNQLIHTVEIMNELENPFDNVDVVETFEEERSEVTTGESTSSATMEGTTTQQNSSTASSNTSAEQSNSATSTGENTQQNLRKHSDTPQNNLNNINNWLTDVTVEDNTTISMTSESSSGTTSSDSESSTTSNDTASSNSESTTSNEGSSNSQGTVKHTLSRKGNQGVNTYAHDIIEFRESILNIEQMIITDKRIAELFMLVY